MTGGREKLVEPVLSAFQLRGKMILRGTAERIKLANHLERVRGNLDTMRDENRRLHRLLGEAGIKVPR